MREWREPQKGDRRICAPVISSNKIAATWPPKWLCYVAGLVNGILIGFAIGWHLAGGKP